MSSVDPTQQSLSAILNKLGINSSKEANVIKGVNSSQIGQLLGYPGRTALIHRNDMAITDNSLERKQ